MIVIKIIPKIAPETFPDSDPSKRIIGDQNNPRFLVLSVKAEDLWGMICYIFFVVSTKIIVWS